MRDVRMRGFAERADVEEVQAFLAKAVGRLGPEPVELLACVGRVLAEDVTSEFDVPGFDRAAPWTATRSAARTASARRPTTPCASS
jgi:molybdopterin biosynthesis enzyme